MVMYGELGILKLNNILHLKKYLMPSNMQLMQKEHLDK